MAGIYTFFSWPGGTWTQLVFPHRCEETLKVAIFSPCNGLQK